MFIVISIEYKCQVKYQFFTARIKTRGRYQPIFEVRKQSTFRGMLFTMRTGLQEDTNQL